MPGPTPLFAALFGYGLVRILENQRSRGRSEAAARATVRRRCGWMILFGALHAMLAFSGDILGWYGLLGVVLVGVLRLRDRALLWLSAGWLAAASAVQGLVYSQTRVSDQRSYLWSFAIDDPLAAAAWRPLEWVMTPFGLLCVVSPLLVGAWAARHRVLEDPHRHRVLLRRTAVLGIGAGLLGGLGMALVTIRSVAVQDTLAAGLSWLHIATGVPCGLGYAALLSLWSAGLHHRPGPRLPWIIDALRATGERSLSCYLAQTVVFATLLPAWSFGWGAALGTAGAAVLAMVTWAATVVGAAFLDRAGRRGPAEAILRRLTYGRSGAPPVRATIVS